MSDVPRLRPFAPDQPGAEDGNVVNPFAPDEAVVPVVVAIVLIGLPGLIGLGRVVAVGRPLERRARAKDRRPLVEVKRNVALQPYRVARIRARRKANRTAAGRRSRLNRPVDSRRIDSLPVAGRAIHPHVVDTARTGRRRGTRTTLRTSRGRSGHTRQARPGKLQKVSAK